MSVRVPPPLYADDDLLIIAKPAPLLTIPGRAPDKADCLWSRLKTAHPEREIFLVHRLDRDTTGLMVFACTREAQRHLGRQFERRLVRKEYQAIVHGEVREANGVIDAPMKKDWTRNDPPVYVIDHERGKSAITRWRREWVHAGFSGVRLFPETGRSHQLRVHLLSIGHPIAGDPIYAPPGSPPGLRLHAANLSFLHPASGEAMSFTTRPDWPGFPAPADFPDQSALTCPPHGLTPEHS